MIVTYYGNQRVSVEDESDAKLTYSGAFDFVDGVSRTTEYTYNANGALTKDLNRGIKSISYDVLGNPVCVSMRDGNSVEYVYAADGTRLKATHVTKESRDKFYRREKYYRGKMIFDDILTRLPRTVLVPGGYYFYESADDAFFLSLYVQDYQGNNRAELYNGNNIFEQTHYYPYGGIIGDLSSAFSQTHGNDYKFSGKELDRQFGLDLYDFHARQYDAGVPTFDRPDPFAEKFYSVTPYVYCLDNPVNCVDKDGKWVHTLIGAAVGALIEGGFEIYDQIQSGNEMSWGKVAVAAGKGAVQGAIATSGLGLIADVTVNAIGGAAVETVGQAVEVATGLSNSINTDKINQAFCSGAASAIIGFRAGKEVEKQVAKHFNSASAVRQFKSEAVQNITQKAKQAHTTPNLTPKAIKNEAHRIKQGKMQQWENGVNVGINSATQAGADAFIRKINNNNK